MDWRHNIIFALTKTTTMKANELRIGNWVASSGNPTNKETWVIGKVVSISSLASDFEQLEIETEEEFTWFFRDNYFGIPLTEEWLVKFGFKLYPSGYFCLDLGSSNTYFSMGLKHHKTLNLITEQYESTHLIEFKHIEYVHQLQNLYFALTCEELEIK